MASRGLQFWKVQVDGYNKSGLSQAAYARQHGYSGSGLSYWRKRFATTKGNQLKPANPFVPVKVVAAPTLRASPSVVRVVLPDGTIVEAPVTESISAVAEVVALLRGGWR